ncbi:hypothetical protein A9Q84_03450 [Halobacteriovorax marinus]|uniref:Outer membrane protein n=1 Tax=Halobacteriovorax marinus TaxID=97084 RepID=A0A1Y5F9Z2_9BACT|nr:hypothetical protein A9Q84_03450 [Halobacteriovorax marinus]
MKSILLVLITFVTFNSSANYFEFFGSHVSTSGIGNQANLNPHDPSNNYYIPALMAFSDTVNFAASISSAQTDFKAINNVVIQNDSYQDPALNEQTGSVDTDYQKYISTSLHFAVPLARNLGTLALSLSTPVGNLMETNSGNPYLPEYVMYRSRYRRTIIYLNLAKKFSDSLAFSLGTQLGFQAAADVNTQVSIQSDFGSQGSAKSKIKPTLALLLSGVYKPSNDSHIYLSYQQEMKNNLEANAFGKVSISTTTDYILDLNISSMIYYDPHIIRLGTATTLGLFKLYGLLEYQMWGNYKTPVVRVAQRGGGIKPSSDYEVTTTEDIFVPKLGMAFSVTDNFELDLGIVYKPTPLKGDFSGSGNSVDTDSTILAGAALYKTKLFEIPMQIGAAMQYHKLKEVKVVKSSGLENGNAGNKIGSAGYTVGGSVVVGSLGLTVHF